MVSNFDFNCNFKFYSLLEHVIFNKGTRKRKNSDLKMLGQAREKVTVLRNISGERITKINRKYE